MYLRHKLYIPDYNINLKITILFQHKLYTPHSKHHYKTRKKHLASPSEAVNKIKSNYQYTRKKKHPVSSTLAVHTRFQKIIYKTEHHVFSSLAACIHQIPNTNIQERTTCIFNRSCTRHIPNINIQEKNIMLLQHKLYHGAVRTSLYTPIYGARQTSMYLTQKLYTQDSKVQYPISSIFDTVAVHTIF